MKQKIIKISEIVIDAGTQQRVEPTQSVIDEYSEAIKCGAKFPPVTVFSNGVDYYLVDGFHRYFAYKKAGGIDEIMADIHEGTKRDAILFSASVNGTHGLRLTNQDKRKHVLVLLTDDEWSQWSDRDIAKHCKVTQPFVSKIRKDIITDSDKKVITVITSATKPASNLDDDQKLSTGSDGVNVKYDPKETELSEAHETITYLSSENAKLRDALSAGQLPEDEIIPAEKLIIELRSKIAALEAELDAVKSSRDTYQRENNELKAQCKMYQNMLKKAGNVKA